MGAAPTRECTAAAAVDGAMAAAPVATMWHPRRTAAALLQHNHLEAQLLEGVLPAAMGVGRPGPLFSALRRPPSATNRFGGESDQSYGSASAGWSG